MRIPCLLILLWSISIAPPSSAAPYDAGIATVDITPEGPIRLSGYLSRKEEVTEVEQRLFAKALALRSEGGQPVVLLTVDNCALNLALGDEVCARLEQARGIPRERIAINFSHTHSAPALTNCIPNIFGQPIPLDQQDRIEKYTRFLVDAMEKAALAALDDLKPARLYFGIGSAEFGKNRRTPGGPVDHDLPVLCVKGEDGAVRALVAGYACHCTVLSAMKVSGDWAGYAQEYMQEAFPGATGLVTIGCGADQNPLPRGTTEHAIQYGHAIADGVKAVVDGGMREITAPIDAALARAPLAFDTLPTREEWEARAQADSPQGYHARLQMLRLSRGEAIRTEIPYTVQRISFGDELAMLFLAGEVVVDYSTRFKIEYDRNRVWINGYSNDVPCYIPSARILKEGGYEGADAMIYYDQPTKFAPDVEDRIAAVVHDIMPPAYKSDHAKTGGFPPLRPHDALKEFVLPEGYEAQLVASEPQIVDPVAVDFAPDGSIFVAEMHDYNIPPEQNDPPQGRISRLVDTNGDGFYDESKIYLDHVAYPTGVTVWRKGILVCAAPDLIYAEDADGDGVAETRRVLFTGFGKDNYQARLNSLSWGLDNWMYGGGGLLGGLITRPGSDDAPIPLGGRDFRFNPDTLAFETATGATQYGRARDDWDNWFGCDSSNLLKFYALPEDLLKKAPNVVPPPTIVTLASAPYDVYPVSTYVERMNDPDDLNRVTSACGLTIYRDDALGAGFRGNAFNCEPVHNLVTRLLVEPKGAIFTARRAPGEEHSEFIASRDHWFRPGQVRTAPDGTLWVVDMYRYVIEHEKWITPDRREMLDMFAGENMGRIYRIKRKDTPLRPVEDLTKLDTPALVAKLDTPNGTVRDLVHQMLLWRNDPAAVEPLKAMARAVRAPVAARVQALCALDSLHALDDVTLNLCAQRHALSPGDAPLAAQAVRLAAPRLAGSKALQQSISDRSSSWEPNIAQAVGFTLAEWKSDEAIPSIAFLFSAWSGEAKLTIQPPVPSSGSNETLLRAPNAYVVIAALAASAGRTEKVVLQLLDENFALQGTADIYGLASLSAAEGSESALDILFGLSAERNNVAMATSVLKAATARGITAQQLGNRNRKAFDALLALAESNANDQNLQESQRMDCLAFVGIASAATNEFFDTFADALSADAPPVIQRAAFDALAKREDPATAEFLLAKLPDLGPEARNAALDALTRRGVWCALFLDHLAATPAARAQLDAARKQFLLKHPDPDLRARAEALLGGANTARAEVLARYAEVENFPGDAARGLPLFEERCGQCHALDGHGHALGPDLSALTDKSAPALLKAILDPNDTVLEQYQAFTVETKDLRTLSGIVAEETANSVTLKMAGGTEETLLRGDIESITNAGLSLMPEGLEENLAPAQMADVLAFVRSNKQAPKQFKGNSPAPVAPNEEGAYYLTAENAAIFGGPNIEYRPRFGAIGGWELPIDRAEWSLENTKAAEYTVEMTWTAPPGANGAPWRITCGDATLDGALEATGGMENFILREVGRITLAPGAQKFTLAPTAPVKYGMMELRAITLKPVAR